MTSVSGSSDFSSKVVNDVPILASCFLHNYRDLKYGLISGLCSFLSLLPRSGTLKTRDWKKRTGKPGTTLLGRKGGTGKRGTMWHGVENVGLENTGP